jgi:plasmid stabilization system protein ParE
MKYEVVLTNEAQQNARSAYRWYAERSQEVAERWCTGLLEALSSLESEPQRCPLANENDQLPIELRQLLFGSGQRITHRIIFAIRPTKVVIHAIRHVAQQDWQFGESQS